MKHGQQIFFVSCLFLPICFQLAHSTCSGHSQAAHIIGRAFALIMKLCVQVSLFEEAVIAWATFTALIVCETKGELSWKTDVAKQ